MTKIATFSFWVLVLAAFLIGLSAHAQHTHDSGWDFSPVQPIDDKVKSALKWDDTDKAATISDWTQYSMILAPFAVQLDKDKVLVRMGAVAGAHFAVSSATQLTKWASGRQRPNGSNGRQSFFSGHTSAAFTGAGVICHTDKEYCPIALALATTTGYMRIAADRHWFSDVFVGAFVGYAGGNLIPSVILSF